MILALTCAMCGKHRQYAINTDGLDLKRSLKDLIESQPLSIGYWITQQNGTNADIYCSRECAA